MLLKFKKEDDDFSYGLLIILACSSFSFYYDDSIKVQVEGLLFFFWLGAIIIELPVLLRSGSWRWVKEKEHVVVVPSFLSCLFDFM